MLHCVLGRAVGSPPATSAGRWAARRLSQPYGGQPAGYLSRAVGGPTATSAVRWAARRLPQPCGGRSAGYLSRTVVCPPAISAVRVNRRNGINSWTTIRSFR